MNARRIGLLIIGTTLCLAQGCGAPPPAGESLPLRSLDQVADADWQRLAGTVIYFGHQSVGADIVAGVARLAAEDPRVLLTVRETDSPAQLQPGVLAHSLVGSNTSYRSKLEAFADLMHAGHGDRVDIAMLKLCFVDVMPNTDVDRLFLDYSTTMEELRQSFPRTTFVHLTVPLTWRLSGLAAAKRAAKDAVKRLLGLPAYGQFFDNGQRNRLNAMLRSRYQGREPLFDVAAIESAHPDGERETYLQEGRPFFAMAPAYTGDGGHLNEVGRAHVARELLVFLAEVAGSEKSAAVRATAAESER